MEGGGLPRESWACFNMHASLQYILLARAGLLQTMQVVFEANSFVIGGGVLTPVSASFGVVGTCCIIVSFYFVYNIEVIHKLHHMLSCVEGVEAERHYVTRVLNLVISYFIIKASRCIPHTAGQAERT